MNLFVIFLKMLYSYTIASMMMVSMKLALVIIDFLVRSEHMDRNHFLQEQLLLSLSLETDTNNFPSHPLSPLVMLLSSVLWQGVYSLRHLLFTEALRTALASPMLS